MGLDPAGLRDAWARADLPHQKAVLAALTQIDRPTATSTSDPGVGFDCSGLTAFAWARAGVDHHPPEQRPAQRPRRLDQARPSPATWPSTRAT